MAWRAGQGPAVGRRCVEKAGRVVYIVRTGAIGFDGLIEGIVACSGPRPWLKISEKTQLPTQIWRWLRKLSF